MQNQSIFVSMGDLFILFFYGGALYYTEQFIYPIEMKFILVASSFLAFTLGTLGPSPEDIVEWVLFFSLGSLTAALSPPIIAYCKTGAFSLEIIWQTTGFTIPYIVNLISPWAVAVPFGMIFHRTSYGKYYRHARFF